MAKWGEIVWGEFIWGADGAVVLDSPWLLHPKFFLCNNNFEMSLAVISDNAADRLQIYGHFRSENDLGALIWETVDSWSHPSQCLPEVHDFTGVILNYDYLLTGYQNGLDEIYGPSLTVTLTDGRVYYVRLWNYVTGRPQQDWETGGGEVWPPDRTPGSETGLAGHVQLNFDNLYAGSQKYELVDAVWVVADDWQKIDPTTIQELKWSFTPPDYDATGVMTPLPASEPFAADFTDWLITGGPAAQEVYQAPAHNYRLADGYDDNYQVTPERYIEHFWNLGFRDTINLYIGASHYYDKVGTGIATPGEYTSYQYALDPTASFNTAAAAWLADLFAQAAAAGFVRVIASVSLEMTEPPITAPDSADSWVQRTWDGLLAQTGWTPPPYVLSFHNANVQDFHKALFLELAAMQDAAALIVCLQLGESWYWTQDGAPCFYDYAAKEAFNAVFGYYPYEFHSVFESYAGYEATINWFRDQNGAFAVMLRDYLRATYPAAEFTVLFFPPSVVDPLVAGAMMGIANYPKTEWASPACDFFQVEDYDWLIAPDYPQHNTIYDLIETDLGYAPADQHYFAGFALTGPQAALWKRINHAARLALDLGFGQVFIWAGAQIRRDNWLPPAPEATLLLWYKDLSMAEEQDGYLLDHSDYGNNGALLESAAFADEAGKGKLLDLAHEGDTAQVLVCPTDLDGLGQFTLEAWVKPDVPHSGEMISRAGSLRLSLNNGFPEVGCFIGGVEQVVTASQEIAYADWSFLSATYDGAALNLYRNAVLLGALAVSGALDSPGGPAVIIGGGAGNQFYGQIGEVLIWNQWSSLCEIKRDLLRWLAREALAIIELVELYIDPEIQAFTSYHESLNIASYDKDGVNILRTFTPLGFESGGVKLDLQGGTQTLNFKMAAPAALQELLNTYDIRGYPIAFKLTYQDSDHEDPDQVATIFQGRIDTWSLENGVLTLQCWENTIYYDLEFPFNRYTYFCRHRFKGYLCSYGGATARCQKTITYCAVLLADDFHFGGFKTIPNLMRRRTL